MFDPSDSSCNNTYKTYEFGFNKNFLRAGESRLSPREASTSSGSFFLGGMVDARANSTSNDDNGKGVCGDGEGLSGTDIQQQQQ
jgi:hypothetical protein